MKIQLATSLAGALAIWTASASAALAEDGTRTPENRLDAIAARMVRGESYDQAARTTLPGTRSNVRYDISASRMASLEPYDQAANAARFPVPENPDVVNSRWEKHLTAMTDLKGHEAGWTASARR